MLEKALFKTPFALSAALILFAALFTSFVPVSAKACSLFVLKGDGGSILYGQNLDWDDPVPGAVMVNKRGVQKSVLPWKGWWPDSASYDEMTWVSRYGSITFTVYGRDFIDGGMNEAGLVIDQASLGAVYPPVDERPGISCAQWMQYQLDNFGTVEEVVANLGSLRPDGEGWHYLLADSAGDCAVIEYLDGKPLVITGEGLPIPAITNTTYGQAVSHLPMDKAFGGEADIGKGKDSYGRFVRMAALMRDYDREKGRDGVSYSFMILDDVKVPGTRRQVVYDIKSGCVYWKTTENGSLRHLSFQGLGLSAETPALFLYLDRGEGDISGLLEPSTLENNLALVWSAIGPEGAGAGFDPGAKTRGFSLEDVAEIIARHPFVNVGRE